MEEQTVFYFVFEYSYFYSIFSPNFLKISPLWGCCKGEGQLLMDWG